MSEKMTLGEALILDRNKRDLTQAQLARALDVPAQTLNRWEVGGAMPRPHRLMDISRFFGNGSATHEVCNQIFDEIVESGKPYIPPARRRQSANSRMHQSLDEIGATYIDLRNEFGKQFMQEQALYDSNTQEPDGYNDKLKTEVIHLYREYEGLTRELSRKLAEFAVRTGDDIL